MKKHTSLAVLLLLLAVVTLVDWEVLASCPWWHVPLFGIPTVGVFVLAFGWRRRRSLVAIGGGLLGAGLLGAVLALLLVRGQSEANRAMVDGVAVALDSHWRAHGKYPQSLADLVPASLADVPVPAVGVCGRTALWYTPSDKEGDFALGYRASAGIGLVLRNGVWSTVPLPR